MSMQDEVLAASRLFQAYHRNVLRPSAESFLDSLDSQSVALHRAFEVSLIAAHAVDYLRFVGTAAGAPMERKLLLAHFDQALAVPGARFRNGKFRLVDAVANAVKHVRLDPHRHADIVSAYGAFGFDALAQDGPRVVLGAGGFRFDYTRVALRHVLIAWLFEDFDDPSTVLDWAEGRCVNYEEIPREESESDDSIDELVFGLQVFCGDCGETEDDCACSSYVYGDLAGEFNPPGSAPVDIDRLLDLISPNWRR